MKAIIIDDEKSARENLTLMLNHLKSDILLLEADSILSAHKIIQEEEPQVIFLDINMPQHEGFELFELINLEDFIVVVVTANLSHSITAIQKRVFDFLLKPFGFTTLKQTLERIDQELVLRQKRIKQSDDLESSFSDKIKIKTKTELFFVDPEELMYCESDNNYTTMVLKNNNKILMSKTIKLIEADLKQPYFYRIHRSFIVNLNYIESFNSHLSIVKLKDNSQLPVSDRKKRGFLEYFENFKK